MPNAPVPHSQPSHNELRSISQSTRDGRCLEVWFARNVTDEDRAILSGTIVSHASLKADNEQLRKALLSVRNWLDVQFNEPFKNEELAEKIGAINDALAPQSSAVARPEK